MATRFKDSNFEYELLEERKNEVVVVDIIKMQVNAFAWVPEDVEYQGQKYKVSQVKIRERNKFKYYGLEYEIIEDKPNEVALIDAQLANGRFAIPSEVEYQGQKYKVTHIMGKHVKLERTKEESCVKKTEVAFTYRGAFQDKFEFHPRYNTGLREIVIPDTITVIGPSAFEGCKDLTSVTIPDGVTSIRERAFCCCFNLATISLPKYLKKIEKMAFSRCDAMKKITIPPFVEAIDMWAFTKYIDGDKSIEVVIQNEEGNVVFHPQALNDTEATVRYVGKPKDVPAQKSEPKTTAKTTAIGSVENKTVAQLSEEFKTQFGSVLRIYNGRSKADDSLSLQEVGLTGNLSLPFDGNQKVGDFIAQMEKAGLKVKVYTCDEWVACLDGLTLTQTGQVKKAATKADMEKML